MVDGRELKTTADAAGASAAIESVGGAAAIVLAIIGLAGILVARMMMIATIVLGAAILLDAVAVGARIDPLVSGLRRGEARAARAELGCGIAAASVAGITGVVLGILALLGLSPTVFCSIALMVFGGGLLLGGPEKSRLAQGVSAGTDYVVGLGAVALGIVALMSGERSLVLVGQIAVGATVLLGGGVLGGRMLQVLRRAP